MVATVMDLELKLVSFMTVLEGVRIFQKRDSNNTKTFYYDQIVQQRENVHSSRCIHAEKRTFLRAHIYQGEISYDSYR